MRSRRHSHPVIFIFIIVYTYFIYRIYFQCTHNIPSLFIYNNKSVGDIASNLDPSSVLVQAPLCFRSRWPVFLRPRTNSQINRNCIDLSCLFDASVLNNDTLFLDCNSKLLCLFFPFHTFQEIIVCFQCTMYCCRQHNTEGV